MDVVRLPNNNSSDFMKNKKIRLFLLLLLLLFLAQLLTPLPVKFQWVVSDSFFLTILLMFLKMVAIGNPDLVFLVRIPNLPLMLNI